MKRCLSLLVCLVAGLTFAEQLTVDPAAAVIVLAGDSDRLREAGEELQYHLELVSGERLPLVTEAPAGSPYVFRLEDQPSGHARWSITPLGVTISGAQINHGVYGFLDQQLGIRWLYPGEEGIVYEQQNPLQLTSGETSYEPKLVFAKIRQSIRKDRPHRPIGKPSTDPFLLSLEEHNRRVAEEEQWIRRLRMGGSRPGGGHAFSDWWDKYHETYPDLFALNADGQREPVPLRKAHQTNEFIKICPSNPQVAELLIEEWLPRRAIQQYISTGPNDGRNFCRCEACLALDVRRAGEDFPGHLTDRYLHLTNQVARLAREHRPDAVASLYGYLTTLDPPRRVEAEPNVLVMLVPYIIPLETGIIDELFAGWRKAGVNRFGFRPNYHHKYNSLSLPLGFEKQYFDVFQTAYRNGTISADYDMLLGHWAVTGMSNYILARAMIEPERDFAYWEAEYAAAYGAAAEQVKAYHRYWREQLWEQRLLPDLERINQVGRAGNFSRGLSSLVGDYYREADFDATDSLLAQANSQPLNERERARLKQLILANQHARLVFRAASHRGQERYRHSLALRDFRLRHWQDLNLSWVRLVGQEVTYNLTATELVTRFQEYPLPWLQTGMAWHFRMDPENVGLQENWQQLTDEQTESWERLRVDNFWEHAYDSETDPDLRQRLADYDGVAWYNSRLFTPDTGRDHAWYAVFGGVGDRCQLYVNGQLAGEYTVPPDGDERTPFRLRIDPQIDWDQRWQQLTVRVENRDGLGGIYNRVWILSQPLEP